MGLQTNGAQGRSALLAGINGLSPLLDPNRSIESQWLFSRKSNRTAMGRGDGLRPPGGALELATAGERRGAALGVGGVWPSPQLIQTR